MPQVKAHHAIAGIAVAFLVIAFLFFDIVPYSSQSNMSQSRTLSVLWFASDAPTVAITADQILTGLSALAFILWLIVYLKER